MENHLFNIFSIYFYFDDYYESLYNVRMNDLYGLFISYYYLNSFEFLIIGILLLIASLVSVNINQFNRNIKSNNYYDLLSLFNFFDDFIKFLFLRKQNLLDQSITSTSTRIFKKKINK